jgi:hypothetical protein
MFVEDNDAWDAVIPRADAFDRPEESALFFGLRAQSRFVSRMAGSE